LYEKAMSLEPEFENLMAPTLNLGSRERPLEIHEITHAIKSELEARFSELVIVGEVSNFKAHPSGHHYFVLKDDKATMSAVMFKAANSQLKFQLQNGQRVLGFGRISVYPPRGSYQIVLSRIEPDGIGSLQLAFEQLKEKLKGEGLFDSARKKALPRFPKKIGIITSSSGAAVQDILNVLLRRFSGLEILIYNVKVQGEGAAGEISEAIHQFNEFFSETEVLIVGRGGGSLEDLWAFNEERVARAIFDSKIPVISAVGHEVDFSISDFVADLRAPTPSAAAELVVADRIETLRHLENLQSRLNHFLKRLELLQMRLDDGIQSLERALKNQILGYRNRFQSLEKKLFQLQPQLRLQRYEQKWERLTEALSRIGREQIRWRVERTKSLQTQLLLLNPRAIMQRGYSLVRLEKSKKLVRKASDVSMGDHLIIEFSKGSIRAKV
jgi:exodeoxyribonuclease VII large subunit